MEQRDAGPSKVADERRKVLATLVDAYLRNSREFRVMSGDNIPTITHPGLPSGGYAPEWSHVQALAAEGHLLLTPLRNRNSWTINIPSHVLAEVESDAPGLQVESSDQQRVERLMTQALNPSFFITNNFHGGSPNVAVGSQHFSQSVVQGVQPGDIESLFDALRSFGIDEEDLLDLQEALVEDERTAGHRTIGTRVNGWFGEFLTEAAQQVTATGALAAAGRLPEILNALQAYVG